MSSQHLTIKTFNLLALDGGCVKGISSLLILRKIMERIREIENEPKFLMAKQTDSAKRKPVDYFYLAAGTSTGGIIALMLFRLEMRCSDVMCQYEKMSKMVFGPKLGNIQLDDFGASGKWVGDAWLKTKAVTGHSEYRHQQLEKAIDAVVAAYPLDANDEAKKGDAMLMKPGKGRL